MIIDILLRFIFGGVIVSVFALAGDLLKPKSFVGLFGAAPSVALATLGLTIAKEGRLYASTECRSMLIGAIALGAYSSLVCWLLIRWQIRPLRAAVSSMIAWFFVAFGIWFLAIRT